VRRCVSGTHSGGLGGSCFFVGRRSPQHLKYCVFIVSL
jgi:hypothetical protein